MPHDLAETLSVSTTHTLRFTQDVFAVANSTLAEVLPPRETDGPVRALVVWDAGLRSAWPELPAMISRWF